MGILAKVARLAQVTGFAALAALGAGEAQAQGRTFVAEGTDVAFGLGARGLSMGNTGTSNGNDPHSIFYNPALIAGFDRPMISITRQANAQLRPYSFLGLTTPFPLLEPLGWDMVLGFANYPRVHSRSTGAFTETDPQSVFLRFLLPGVSGTYDGDIDSKTLVWRFAIGLQPANNDRLQLGFVIDRIDCKTNACGIHAGSVGYQIKSVHATAFSLGAGVTYKLTDRFTIAASVFDIDTDLYVVSYTEDGAGKRWQRSYVDLPRNVNIEAAWQANDRLLVTGGYRSYAGDYGTYKLSLKTLHLGAEYSFAGGWKARGGLWRPLEISANNGLSPQLPFPVAPTVGAGWSNDRFSMDAALYVHPIMSFHYGRPAPTVEVSLGYKF